MTTERCQHCGGPPRDTRDNNFLTRQGGRNYLDKTFFFFFLERELSFHIIIRAHVKHELRRPERARWKLPRWSSGFGPLGCTDCCLASLRFHCTVFFL